MLLSMIPIAIVPFDGIPLNGIAWWNGSSQHLGWFDWGDLLHVSSAGY
jgi:hypothetical protein